MTWDIPGVLAMLREKLGPADAELLTQIADVLNDRTRLASLGSLIGPAVEVSSPPRDAACSRRPCRIRSSTVS